MASNGKGKDDEKKSRGFMGGVKDAKSFIQSIQGYAVEDQAMLAGLLLVHSGACDNGFSWPMSEVMAHRFDEHGLIDKLKDGLPNVLPKFQDYKGEYVDLKDFEFLTKNKEQAKALMKTWAIKIGVAKGDLKNEDEFKSESKNGGKGGKGGKGKRKSKGKGKK